MQRDPFSLQARLEDAILDFFRAKGAVINEIDLIDTYDHVFASYDLAVAMEKVFDDYQASEIAFAELDPKPPTGSWITYVMLPSGWFPVRESIQESKAASINEARRLYRNYVTQTVVVGNE